MNSRSFSKFPPALSRHTYQCLRSDNTHKNQYTIYSTTATKSGGGSFYDLKTTCYYIVTNSNSLDFIEITGSYYISKIVNNIADGLTLNCADYTKIWNNFSYLEGVNISSIALVSSVEEISVSGTSIIIEKDYLEAKKGQTITFEVVLGYGSVYRTVTVDIVVDVNVTQIGG